MQQNQPPLHRDDLRYAFHGNLKTAKFCEYLGSEPSQTSYTIKTYKSLHQKNSICVCIDRFFAQKGIKVDARFGMSEEDVRILRKEDIEVAPGKFAKCIVDGILFLTWDGVKLVLELEESYSRYDSWDLSLYYRNADENKALNLINELDEFSKKHTYLKNSKISPDLSFIPLDTSYSWDDVILPPNVKEELTVNVQNLLSNMDIYIKNNIRIKRGLLLKGVPGTGKTQIGKVLCHQAKCTFIWVTPKFLTNSGYVHQVCSMARDLAPSILFLEDVDLYGGHRDSSNNTSVLGELMNQLDGLVENNFVITIATTNNAEKIEDALRNRPGRFDKVIDIPKPDYDARLKMLELHSKQCDISSADFKKISKKTDEYTGAHVRELVNVAIMSAIEENSLGKDSIVVLKTDHFLRHIEEVKTKTIAPIGFCTKSDSIDILDDL